jgi:formate hydrogenlyase subunit 3/multisubunit Na+/H+ antiporter MnhD subunit
METHSFCALIIPIAFALLGSGMLVALLSGKRTNDNILSLLLFAACLALGCGAACNWPMGYASSSLPLYMGGVQAFVQRGDVLSLLFLLLLGVVGLAVALFSPAYLKHFKDRIQPGIFWFALFVFIGSMAQVFLSADAITFIVFWELMSLSSVALVVSDYASHKAKNAAHIYLGATRISTTFIFGGFLWMYSLSHSWLFSDWASLGHRPLAPLLLIFLGLCIKAGTWPFHLWLPYAHTEAPAPISALMSGIMVKVAIYAMLRLLLMPATALVPIAYVAIALGAISAFWGILFAQVYPDLKRLLAYSTVENIGLIVISLGLAMLAKAKNLPVVGSIALAACLYHCINHALYKPLLFLSTGAVDSAAHSRDLSRLGGLEKKMPWTAAMFFFGSMAICALPPLNGFNSKWLIYQGLFQFTLGGPSVYDRTIGMILIGVLAMVGALSVACFAKGFGLAFLGRARTSAAEHAEEVPASALLAQGLLVAGCVVLSLGGPWVVHWFAPVALAILPSYNVPVSLPEVQVVIALAVLIPCIYMAALRGAHTIRRFVTWECGYGEISRRALISAASFERSIMTLFGKVVQYRVESEISGRDRRHFPDLINVRAANVSLMERVVYRPVLKAFEAAGNSLIKLQTASIHVHLLYVFATLILFILIGTRP